MKKLVTMSIYVLVQMALALHAFAGSKDSEKSQQNISHSETYRQVLLVSSGAGDSRQVQLTDDGFISIETPNSDTSSVAFQFGTKRICSVEVQMTKDKAGVLRYSEDVEVEGGLSRERTRCDLSLEKISDLTAQSNLLVLTGSKSCAALCGGDYYGGEQLTGRSIFLK